MTEPEYDERTCITAGELRGMGCEIPSDIPDCGWVPRSALRFGELACTSSPDDCKTGVWKGRCMVDVVEPFRWIELDVTIGD
jgi:hypothetical protein